MFNERDNLKDERDIGQNFIKDSLSISVPYTQTSLLSDSYPKLNKLITALYIVTDIMDKEEPLRLNLRTLGAEILSDTNSTSKTKLSLKVNSILSFLDIARAINLISEMNLNILKKEFFELSQSIEKFKEPSPVWLEQFLMSSPKEEAREIETNKYPPSRSIGVQKGSTLMQALSDRNYVNTVLSDSNFLKKQRRDDILKAIEGNGGSGTITDIRTKASARLSACGEKTLQRELVSMVKDGLLKKTGEKRWSKYFIQ